jgi:hypothetical protein
MRGEIRFAIVAPSPRVGSWARHGVHGIETFCRQARKGVVEVIR